MASVLHKAQTHDDRVHGSRKVKVTILASEWGSSNGGLSTINRELAIQLAKFPEVEITFFLPKCSQEDKNIALDHKVKIVEATPLSCFEELDWLCYPPDDLEIDIVVGHGIRLGKQAQVIKKSKTCKWVQVVHKDPEELKMFESYSSPNSKGEEKHKNEVELCEMADHVVGVGPKLSKSFRSYLSGCDKDGNVFDLTPGVFEELKTVKQVSHSDGQQRRVLVFGHGDVEDFKLKGLDIAGKAIAALEDTLLVFVGAPDGKHEEIRKRLIKCGVPAGRLKIKGFVQNREGLKRLFKQVDLAVMPSRTEGFGLTGLEAMSAGLPVLVSGNSGFGEALCSVAFGSSFVIKSEDPVVWTAAIQKIWSKDRKCRLEEAVSLRDNYGRKYNWAKQIKELVDRMVSLTHEDSLNAWSSLETKCNASQRMEGITEDHEGTSSEDSGIFFKKHIRSNIVSHEGASSLTKEPLKSWSIQNIPGSTSCTGVSPSQTRESLQRSSMPSIHTPDPVCQAAKEQSATEVQNQKFESDKLASTFIDLVTLTIGTPDLSDEKKESLKEILKPSVTAYMKYRRPSTLLDFDTFFGHMTKIYETALVSVKISSLVISVKCPTLESLERLWKDYQSGCLNGIAERFLVTDELKRKLGLDNVRLKTTIEEENYLICKRAFLENSAEASITETSCQTVDSGQVEDRRWSEDKKQAPTPMGRAEKAKIVPLPRPDRRPSDSGSESTTESEEQSEASKGSLPGATISRQRETVKELPESGQDVDQSDEISPLSTPDRRPSDSGSESPKEREEESQASRGPLHKAAIRGEYKMVKIRVECGEDVDQRDQFSLTPLHLACWYGQESVVKLLLKHGANVNAEDRFQRTPLQYAEHQNHHSIVQLLRNDARLSLHQPDKKLVLTHMERAKKAKASKGSLHRAAVSGQHETVSETECVDLSDDLFDQSDLLGPSILRDEGKKLALTHRERAERAKASRGPLHKAAISGQYKTVKMLLESGEDVDQRDQFFLTPLHLACWYGQESVVNLLLKHGANVNAEDRFQRTPLQKAERQNHHSVMQLLLKNDARPSFHQPVSLKNLSRKAFLQVDKKSGFNLLHVAVFEQNNDIILKASVLLDNFVKEMENVKTRNSAEFFAGKTAFDISQRFRTGYKRLYKIYEECAEDNRRLTELQWGTCIDDAEQAVELVLNDGVDVNASGTDNDYTALLHASRSSSSQFIETLIDLGADVNAQRRETKVTPLLLAADWNNYMASSLLVEHGTEVNVQDRYGLTALHLSVQKDHDHIVRLLVTNKADVNIQDNKGVTPLNRTVAKRRWRVNLNLVTMLLKHNADVNIQDEDGETSLHLAVQKCYDENLLRLGLEHHADLNIRDNRERTALHLAVNGRDENLVRLCLEHHADVNIQNNNGDTALHLAVNACDENLVRLCLEHHADVNIQNNNGHTALHFAVNMRDENPVRLCLEHHADVNIQDNDGCTALSLAVKVRDENLVRLLLEHHVDVSIQDKDGYTPLYWSFMLNNEKLVRLFLEHKADVNTQSKDGSTLLHQSVKSHDENLVRLLLQHHADVNIQDDNGYTPLHRSVITGVENVVRLLLAHNADVNIKQRDGFTPLHLSARYRARDCSQIIDLLVQYGVENIDICDAEGLTPLQMAVRSGNAQAVKKLLDLGADVSVVKADETDAESLKLLKNEAERMEEHLKFEMGSAQKANRT